MCRPEPHHRPDTLSVRTHRRRLPFRVAGSLRRILGRVEDNNGTRRGFAFVQHASLDRIDRRMVGGLRAREKTEEKSRPITVQRLIVVPPGEARCAAWPVAAEQRYPGRRSVCPPVPWSGKCTLSPRPCSRAYLPGQCGNGTLEFTLLAAADTINRAAEARTTQAREEGPDHVP